jgi:hypothetical protein
VSRFAISLALLGIGLVLLPDAARACSVCYGGAEESRRAFLLTTVLLSLLPLSMFAALGWWVWRSALRSEAEAAPPASPTSSPTA